MDSSLPSPSSGSRSPSSRPRPQTVSEILCREVGAAHPDGALKQIRTMKRLLRSHYVAQKRLERYGVSSITEAIETIEALRSEIRELKADRRNDALSRVKTLDDALVCIQRLRMHLHDAVHARADDASSERESDAALPTPPAPTVGFDAERDAPSDIPVSTPPNADDLRRRHDAMERRLHEHRQRIAELEAKLDAAQTSDVES